MGGLKEISKEQLIALYETHGNVRAVAEALNVSRTFVWKSLKSLGIDTTSKKRYILK
jgi:transcriptional regulator of acetoin/glycerol metabolism